MVASGNAINQLGYGPGAVEVFRGWDHFSIIGLAYIDPSLPSRQIPFVIPGRQKSVVDKPMILPRNSYVYRSAVTIPKNINWSNRVYDPNAATGPRVEIRNPTLGGGGRLTILESGTQEYLTIPGKTKSDIKFDYEQVSTKPPSAEYGWRWMNTYYADATTNEQRRNYMDGGLVISSTPMDPGQDARSFKNTDPWNTFLAGRRELETGINDARVGNQLIPRQLSLIIPNDLNYWSTFDGKKSAVVLEISGYYPNLTATSLETAFAGTDLLHEVLK